MQPAVDIHHLIGRGMGGDPKGTKRIWWCWSRWRKNANTGTRDSTTTRRRYTILILLIMKWILFIFICACFLLLCFIGIMVWAIGEQVSKLIDKIEKLQK